MAAALLVMVAAPEFPEATEIRLVWVPMKPPCKVALAEPVLSPMVIAPVPKAPATVMPTTVPSLISKPPLKVFAPPRLSVPVPVLVSENAPLTIPLTVKPALLSICQVWLLPSATRALMRWAAEPD